jgi:hypothetical protein
MIGGAILLVLGALFLLAPKVPWLGQLPGDIRVDGRHGSFRFPLATCLVVSVVLTVLLNVVLRLFKK